MRRLGIASHSRPPMLCAGEEVCVRSRGGVPVRLEWRERVLPVVAVEGSWCVSGRWWLDAERCGVKRRYFRVCVQTPSGNTMCLELFRVRDPESTSVPQATPHQWRVWRVAD